MKKKIVLIVAIIALVAILGAAFVACNADSYASKLEKKGYNVEILDNMSAYYPTEWVVSAINPQTGDFVSVVKYQEESDAEQMEAVGISAFGPNMESIYRSGKIVIVGTEQGVKDAK